MAIVTAFLSAVFWIISSGYFFSGYKPSRTVRLIAGILATLATLFLIRDIFSLEIWPSDSGVEETSSRPPGTPPPAKQDAAPDDQSGSPVATEEETSSRESLLADEFETRNYPDGVVIVGIKLTQEGSQPSAYIEQELVLAIRSKVESLGFEARGFAPTVYRLGYFDRMFSGDLALFIGSGLAAKARAAVMGEITGSCRAAQSNSSLVTCRIALHLRIWRAGHPAGEIDEDVFAETGPGTSVDDALLRAVNLLIERNPHLLDKIPKYSK